MQQDDCIVPSSFPLLIRRKALQPLGWRFEFFLSLRMEPEEGVNAFKVSSIVSSSDLNKHRRWECATSNALHWHLNTFPHLMKIAWDGIIYWCYSFLRFSMWEWMKSRKKRHTIESFSIILAFALLPLSSRNLNMNRNLLETGNWVMHSEMQFIQLWTKGTESDEGTINYS